MKSYKLIIPALVAALSVGFTACDDDDDYTEGVKTPGAFFPEGLSTALEQVPEATSLDLPVQRTDVDAPSSYTVTLADTSGVFSAPATVSFADSSLVSALTLSYDPAKLVMDVPYAVSVTLGDANVYGDATYNFTVTKTIPKITVDAGPKGTATYTYVARYEGAQDKNLKAYYKYSVNSTARTYYIEGAFGDGEDDETTITFEIEMPDSTNIINGKIPCEVYMQETKVPLEGATVYVADYYWAMVALGQDPNDAKLLQYKANSYYVPADGLFVLDIVQMTAAGQGWTGYDEVQLAGFPKLNVEVAYKGMFYDPQNNASVLAIVNSGADCKVVKVALVNTASATAAVQAVTSGAVEAQEVDGGTEVEVALPVTEGGNYYLVAVSYDEDGVAQKSATQKVTVALGEEWESLGMGLMQDGWVLPSYLEDYTEVLANVEIAKSNLRENKYALINPFGENNILTAKGVNLSNGKAVVEFEIDGTWVSMEPQACGFVDEDGAWSISNVEGFHKAKYPDYSNSTIQAAIANQGIELSTFEDGVVVIPMAMFGIDDAFGYTYKVPTTSLIQFPGADEAVVAKAKAKAIAAPNVNGIAGKASIYNKCSKYRFPAMPISKRK